LIAPSFNIPDQLHRLAGGTNEGFLLATSCDAEDVFGRFAQAVVMTCPYL
jgi:hypothetical protein